MLQELIKNDLWLLQWVALMTSLMNLTLFYWILKHPIMAKIRTN